MREGLAQKVGESRPARKTSSGVDALELGPTDAELVERAKRGDRWAQEAIFRRHVNAVGRLARRLLARRDDAEDVVQETFTTALTSLDSLADGALLERWLLRTAVFRVRRVHRKRRFLSFFGMGGEPDALLASLAAPGASPEVLADLGRIDAMLARLPTEERIAWMLRHVEGETLEDVARLTGCSLATAKRRIAAVQVRMTGALGREGAP